MSTFTIDGIGLLVTNDPDLGDGPLGLVPDAYVVIDGMRVAAVGTGEAPPADLRLDVRGRCVIPGFVDSHTHLVFAGDRSDEFAARPVCGCCARAGAVNLVGAPLRDLVRAIAAARADTGRARPVGDDRVASPAGNGELRAT